MIVSGPAKPPYIKNTKNVLSMYMVAQSRDRSRFFDEIGIKPLMHILKISIFSLKSVHFKKTVARFRFFQNCGTFCFDLY